MELKPVLKVFTGTMFSGKTDALLAALRRYTIAKKNILLFKPLLDDRYSEEEVVTHDGNSMTAIPVKNMRDILNYIDDTTDVIGIDEIQFFHIEETTEIIDALLWQGYPVLVAGLDMDYKGRPFGAMPYLMAKAEDVTKFKAVCSECGEDSSFEYRKDTGDNNLVKLGGSDAYDSLCRTCRQKRLMRAEEEGKSIIGSDEITDISFSGTRR
jgi:thymidine kinase